MLSELALPHIRCCLSAIPSDLMKSTAVDESLSSMNQQFCSRENQLLQMLQQNEKSTQKSIFMFTLSIISIITITLVIYLFCKHKHIRTIVAILLLYKAKEVEARTPIKIDDSECGTLAYIGIALKLLSMAIVILLHYRKSKCYSGHRFLNIVKIVLSISDVQHYIPIKLCKTSGSLNLFKITGTLTSEDIKLNKNYLWDTLEINWDKIKLSFNSNEIKLPKLVTIKIQDKIRVRRMMSREMQNFHIMVKQGMMWYHLETV